MNTTKTYALLIAIGCSISGAAALGAVPGAPGAPLVVQQDISGRPPAIVKPDVASLPAGATHGQFEFWKILDGGKSSSFAKVSSRINYYNDDYYFSRTSFIEDDRCLFLRGAGPSGYRLFPAGTYRVLWRGQNASGKGPASPATEFQVVLVDSLSIRVVDAPPAVVGPVDDLAFTWTNNFAANKYKLKILQGKKTVRNKTLTGGYSRYWLDESFLQGETYRDRPKSPAQELPSTTGYVFQVSGYSPNAKKWSPWAVHGPFAIARGTPETPTLIFSQQDYNLPEFTKSPRPFFFAQYGAQPALWSYFDIRKVSAGPKVVRKLWVSRYEGSWSSAFTNRFRIGGSYGYWDPQSWNKDLPPGTYVWSVRASNGRGAGEVVVARTDEVYAAGASFTNVPPSPGRMSKGANWAWFAWPITLPNAYDYQLQIYRNDKLAHTSPVLNVMKRSSRADFQIDDWEYVQVGDQWQYMNTGSYSAEMWYRIKLSDGTFKFRIRGVNKSNPPGQRYSPWSELSPPASNN